MLRDVIGQLSLNPYLTIVNTRLRSKPYIRKLYRRLQPRNFSVRFAGI